jgi:hypothetical protein
VRQQTGIDEMLRAEGLHGGLNELRSLMRGGGGPLAAPAAPPTPRYQPPDDPYHHIDIDVSREYPPDGPDSKGALPDDLTQDDAPRIASDALATASDAPRVVSDAPSTASDESRPS